MVRAERLIGILVFGVIMILTGCKSDSTDPQPDESDPYYFGSDLSFVNEILDHNGQYKDGGEVRSPYRIFKDHGNNFVRLRLWHNPQWTDDGNGKMYSDLQDVAEAIELSRAQEMKILLDFHFSDTWADPGKQFVPEAWKNITSIAVLEDSIYNYTFKTLQSLDARGLMPDMVQLGNETNCGMLYSGVGAGFPALNGCNGDWQNLGRMFNKAIAAVRDIGETSTIDPKIVLHVADPANVDWFFGNLTSQGGVIDFDVIGFSYYPLWHRSVSVDLLSSSIQAFKAEFAKDILILETAYPWTTQSADDYDNLFGTETPIAGYPFSLQGQFEIMKKINQEVMDGGGLGTIYWEPAWITSNMTDEWGTGSSWENATLFDFEGNVMTSIDYMQYDYNN
jgi:arabinogalactan endo-1,4-beta-galactosidase